MEDRFHHRRQLDFRNAAANEQDRRTPYKQTNKFQPCRKGMISCQNSVMARKPPAKNPPIDNDMRDTRIAAFRSPR